MKRDDDLRVRPGRIRATRRQRTKPFIAQPLAAAERAGGLARRSSASTPAGAFGRGRAASLVAMRGMTGRSRSAVIKARVVRHGMKRAPLAAHLTYLRRDGVTKDGEPARMFGAGSDDVDHSAFAERCEDDRHHFRFIVPPEDATELSDIKAFIRGLMADAERDIATRLDWVAVDHWNTEHPHIHVIVRGRTDDDQDLVISRDYIREGMRARAQQLLTLELGPRSDREIHHALESQAGAERWTRLGQALSRDAAVHDGVIDLRPGPGQPPGEFHVIKIGRMRKLETLGLAHPLGAAQWSLSENAEGVLRELGERGDIIKRIHQSLTGRGWERAATDFVLRGEAETTPVTGRVVARELDDELKGSAFVVIDGVDGHAHHIRLPDLDAAGDSVPGSIVELRRYEDAAGRQRLAIAVRSDFAIDAQTTAQGATWLDRRLVSGETVPIAEGGFGHEVRESMNARIDHLVEQGLARRQSQRVIFVSNLLDALRRRELEATAAKLSAETGLPYQSAVEGEHVAGIYRQRMTLASGRFAMIDNGLGFSLVPWSPSLEHQLGKQVSGIARSNGGIDWSFGRRWGLGI
ncbi:MAG: relaxase/mobilization nuclease domain-containing protein [Methylocella sp.]